MILLLDIERAVAVTAPLKLQISFTLKRALLIILLIIIFDFLINFCRLLYTVDSNGVGGCFTVAKYIHLMEILNVIIILNFLVIVLTISVCAILIIYKLRQQQADMVGCQSGGPINDTQVSVMLLCLILLYIITTLPILIHLLYVINGLKTGKGGYEDNLLFMLTHMAHMLKDLGHVATSISIVQRPFARLLWI